MLPNSTRLYGDVPEAVKDLKHGSDTTLVIMGSGVRITSLLTAGLIDGYLLMIHPLVLGNGRRLFAGGPPAALKLVDSGATASGVLIAT